MELYIVTWTSEKLPDGKKDFLIKEAFDNSDAIVKVKRQMPKEWFSPGETFKAKRVVFNEHDTFSL